MGFISFNENYYKQKLKEFESRDLNSNDIYEVKQLLKVLDDLKDEGYSNLNETMEKDFSCLTRLQNIIKKYNETPFVINHQKLNSVTYSDKEYELEKMLKDLINKSNDKLITSSNPFLNKIYDYCEWINIEEDTAYIFLLRDSLLPFIYFNNKGYKNLYPYLISRKFLEDITGIKNIDDEIRLPLYKALENGYIEFNDYFNYAKKEINKVIDKYPLLKKTLLNLLANIKQDKIIVIESGYMGTIPMMLKSLDSRVDFKLFTTAPFLYKTYKDKIFTNRYEDIREFETLYSQEYLLNYSSYNDSKFYVNIAMDKSILDKSLEEIKYFKK